MVLVYDFASYFVLLDSEVKYLLAGHRQVDIRLQEFENSRTDPHLPVDDFNLLGLRAVVCHLEVHYDIGFRLLILSVLFEIKIMNAVFHVIALHLNDKNVRLLFPFVFFLSNRLDSKRC